MSIMLVMPTEPKRGYNSRIFKSVADAMKNLVGDKPGRAGKKGETVSAAYAMWLLAPAEDRHAFQEAIALADKRSQVTGRTVLHELQELLGVPAPTAAAPSSGPTPEQIASKAKKALDHLKKRTAKRPLPPTGSAVA
jgi:hypothetical protein